MTSPGAPSAAEPRRRVVFWGTYDLGKPRVRLLLEGARRAGLEVLECHGDLWSGVEDKSEISGLRRRLAYPLRWLARQPGLVWRYLRLPPHDLVLVPYLGQLDILMLWPWAKLRGKRVAWDAFLSLYDTVVLDRRRVKERSLAARALWALEWLACRAADRVFLDTRAHARAFEEMFRLEPGSVGAVQVGAEELFHAAAEGEPEASGKAPPEHPLEVLFYGQFIPLHGLDTVVDAAALLEARGETILWRIVGSGQEAPRIDRRIEELGLASIRREDWVSYGELPAAIRRADLCLGVFGRSEKASRVIPNKVFQILAAGKPLVTADTPGIRELLGDGKRWPWIERVPPGDPEALAEAVLSLGRKVREQSSLPEPTGPQVGPQVGASEVGRQLVRCLFEDVNEEASEEAGGNPS